MLIIPELERVVILVPRTGTGSLYRAVLAAYPQAFMLYRHMEADGVPHGYDRWQKLGVLRHPVDRLWSLYKFAQTFDGHDPAYVARVRASVDRPFAEWIMRNEVPFSTPYDSAGEGRYWPRYTCLHPIPETRKSQQLYLRPDLGTQIFAYESLASLYHELRLPDELRENQTSRASPPELPVAAWEHMNLWFKWDLSMHRALARTRRL